MLKTWLFCFLFAACLVPAASGQGGQPSFQYTLSFPDPAAHTYAVDLHVSGWPGDTMRLQMPRWMPGYYQFIDYASSVQGMHASDANRKTLSLRKVADNAWLISGIHKKPFVVRYTIKTSRQFVANSYVDTARAYIAPANTFLYAAGYLDQPVAVRVVPHASWKQVVTGLDAVKGAPHSFIASDFDILYDCPILVGNLQELPSFRVGGIEHRFIGYRLGDFNRTLFMEHLQKIVQAASGIIGDIPYRHYTFIGIGPGRGGIEHLNNTTISFDGNGLDKPEAMNRILNFIAHEYFHHYNVKRIRPVELGPFDYEKGSRTNLRWVSEGLSVYYEYLVVKRAGLADASTLLANLSGNLTAHENNPGKEHQSLQQASYSTWSDGPFGNQGKDPKQSISYYDKGPLVGMLLDFEIRNATQNKASLDDVMRRLYRVYYKEKGRGFTEAEFQATCEAVAGKSLASFFEYIYTTKPLDYDQYLAYAGLKTGKVTTQDGKTKWSINRVEQPTPLQDEIWKSWIGE